MVIRNVIAPEPSRWMSKAKSVVPITIRVGRVPTVARIRSMIGSSMPASLTTPKNRIAKTNMPTTAARLWMPEITEYEQAEAIIGTGDADLIALARTILYDPRWPWHAAAHFGAHVKGPPQYLRSQPRQFPNLFDMRADD